MAFCSLKNLTIGIFSKIPKEYMNIENTTLTGMIGNHFDQILVHNDER